MYSFAFLVTYSKSLTFINVYVKFKVNTKKKKSFTAQTFVEQNLIKIKKKKHLFSIKLYENFLNFKLTHSIVLKI